MRIVSYSPAYWEALLDISLRELMEHAYAQIKDAGMRMVMVETGGDSGHAPARALYESEGFVRWPVARYFKDLSG
ncbi:hypothetical protein [Rothia dentocariosa]|uniref:hypothetical protein n=1 Tax=Rothia dentocariosa TaxID=2047 RepID=UPI0028E18A2E|nr:hypothetical protein [Rothia dentocariosa]